MNKNKGKIFFKENKYFILHPLDWQKIKNLTILSVHTDDSHTVGRNCYNFKDSLATAAKVEHAHQPMAQQFHLQVDIHSRETFTYVFKETYNRIFSKHCLKY